MLSSPMPVQTIVWRISLPLQKMPKVLPNDINALFICRLCAHAKLLERHISLYERNMKDIEDAAC